MPATPAWPPRALPRLFVDQPLGAGTAVPLDGKPAHYLQSVLRLGEGDEILLFDDGQSGEWRARIAGAAKKRLVLEVLVQTRPPETLPDVTLAYAPIKRGPLEWLVEKATELGVARLTPIITRRTVAPRPNLDRLHLIAIEAAEQCGRTRLPVLDAPVDLPAFLADAGGALLFADETGGAPLAATAAALAPGPVTLLIGPEGGFMPEEREAILAAGASGISLGPRILRAETAALAALAVHMASAGDWR
jgi:16S rRNA (uracil1498-N3)-methyltransferase